MKTYNRVTVVGRLSFPPDVKPIVWDGDERLLVTFKLATGGNKYTKKDGSTAQTRVTYITSKLWSAPPAMANFFKMLDKGTKLFVDGELVSRSWVGKDGRRNYNTEIAITTIHVLDARFDEDGMKKVGEEVGEIEQEMEKEEEEKPEASSLDLDDPCDLPF